ncbi:MAG: cytidine deaminase [Firmicutes bacterium]|nr:cytidine deaminase [Bacillota bacterium]
MEAYHDGRPSADEVYLRICRVVAERSTCLRRHLGAVIVKDGQITGIGINGAPKGLSPCASVGCIREIQGIASGTQIEICRGIHAEQNAILQAGLAGSQGAVLYTNGFPCEVCAKLCIQAEIARVVASGDYPDRRGLDLLFQAGIEVVILPPLEEVR